MWSTKIKAIDWGFLILVALASFFVSGLPYYPFLNSDIAVHVLMTESFSFRYDLYYWGQDRLGSLLPMTSNIIYGLTSLSPFWIVAIVKWIYLIIGCAAFWYFIPNRAQRWIWTCLWFFPAYEMMYHLLPGHPYAEQMALVGLALIFFDRWLKPIKNHWNVLPLIFLATLSIWVSDFSVLFYVVLFVAFFKSILNRIKDLLQIKNKLLLSSCLALTALMLSFLVFAKLTAARDATYITSMFANAEQLQHSIKLMWFYTTDTVLFKSVSIWNSVYFFATVFLIGIVSIKPNFFKRSTFTLYFLWCSISGFLLILSLRWLAINHVMLKYFIPVFFFLWLGLLTVNWNSGKKAFTWLTTALGILIVTGCAYSILSLYQTDAERIISYKNLDTPFYKTEKSIIGDYWRSYVFAVSNPEIIKATPHDQTTVRNYKLVAEVLSSDTIYVCLDGWLDQAPKNMKQFGNEMELIQSEIKEGNFRFAMYRKRY